MARPIAGAIIRRGRVMSTHHSSGTRARFGDFELNIDAGDLRKGGARVPLPEQPLRLLEVLVEHPGQVVSRDQLREQLWAADTFVDFEHGLNAAVKRLRDALGDSAERPRFIETVPKRGYRFIAQIDGIAAQPPSLAEPPIARSAWRRPLIGAVAVVALATAAGAAWWITSRQQLSESMQALPTRLRRLTFDPGLQTDPTFSPDGRSIAYTSNRSGNFDLWMQPVDGGPAVQLTSDPAIDTQPDWSPDGATILFRSEGDGGGVFALSVADGHSRRLMRDGFAPRWSPDGTRLLLKSSRFGFDYVIANADGNGSQTIRLPSVDKRGWSVSAGWHPSGRLVFLHGFGAAIGLAMVAPSGTSPAPGEIAQQVRARLENLGLVVADNQPLAWSRDGRVLYFSAAANSTQDIWSLTVDPTSLRVTDGPTRLTTGPEMDLVPVVSRLRGMLAFGHVSRSLRVTSFELDAAGRRLTGHGEDVTPSDVDAQLPALSTDGKRLVFQVENPGGHTTELQEITLASKARRTLRVADAQRGETLFGPRWSRDGSRIAYSFREFDPPPLRSSIRVLDLRSGEESLVTSHATTHVADNPWDWSVDGRSVLGGGTRYVAEKFALVRLPLSAAPSAERAAQVLISSRDDTMWQAQEAPDGRWICYNGLPPGNTSSALYVIPATGGTPTALTNTTGWYDYPRWSADGRVIYFLALHQGLFNVWGIPFDSARGRAAEPAFQITHYPEEMIAGVNDVGEIELSVAERRMVVSTQRLSGGIWIMEE